MHVAEEKPLARNLVTNEHVFKNQEVGCVLLSNVLNFFIMVATKSIVAVALAHKVASFTFRFR